MCISRVGKIVSLRGTRATVRLLGDERIVDDIDISRINAEVGSYVELFANLALGTLNPREARQRKEAWLAIARVRT